MLHVKWIGLFFAVTISLASSAQAVGGFPAPTFKLSDIKHKEGKSGLSLGPGNSITIVSGQGTPTTINVLAFSADGKLLAAGKDFGRVVVWNVADRKVLCALNTGEGIVTAVALSPDGRWLATAGQGDNYRSKLWHLPDGKLIRTYDYFGGFVHSLAFGPDGKWMIAWSNDVKVHILDTTQEKQLLVMDGAFSPLLSADGQILMTVARTEFAVWDTASWMKVRSLARPADGAVPMALDAKAGTFVISSSGEFRLMRLDDGVLLPNSPKPDLPRFNPSAGGFAAFREGTPFLFGHSDDRLWAWNSATGQICMSEMMYSESGALSPDGLLLAGSKDNSIFAQNAGGTEVWLWNTDELTSKCFGNDQPSSPQAK
jgi:hypothetical protein